MKLTPGIRLIVSRIVWPGFWREMISWFSTDFAFDVSGDAMPATSVEDEPVTTISSSKSTEPVDWAKAGVESSATGISATLAASV